jgi:hypothetical protein
MSLRFDSGALLVARSDASTETVRAFEDWLSTARQGAS